MKLSPLSIPYRVVQRGASLVFAVAFAAFSGLTAVPFVGPFLIAGALGLGVAAVVGYEVAYYRRYEYELTADTLDIRSGVVSRRNREIPLRRIQNVDISRNVVQRLLGIAAVSLETAGGGATEANIRFVDFEEAKRLQREIRRLKRGATEAGAAATEADATELFAIGTRELALVGLLSFDLRVPGLLFVLLSGAGPLLTGFLPSGTAALLFAVGGVTLVVVLALLSWAAGAAASVANYYDFRLFRTGDELQYERGLLRRYDGSIPLDKIQALTIEDTPLKRYFGYATLVIETAGYTPGQSTGGQSGDGSEAAVPLATRDRVFRLANDVDHFGDPDFERPPKRARRRYVFRYSIALGLVAGALFAVHRIAPVDVPWWAVLVLAPAVPVAAHLKWKHRGWWLGPGHVVTRNGVLTRKTKVVPYYRVQTVIDTRTIFQRRRNLATVTVDTAGSFSIVNDDAAAVDVDRETAEWIRAELDERLRQAVADRRARRRPSGADAEPDAAAESSPDHEDADAEGDGRSDSDAGPSDRPGDGDATDGESDAREGGEEGFVFDTGTVDAGEDEGSDDRTERP
jgi:putative membrane protein